MTIHNTDLSAVKGFIAQNPSNITGDIKTFLSSKKGKIITAVALTAITALLVTGALGVGHVGVLGHSFGASQALLGISISTILLTSIVALGIFLGQARINAWNDERRKKAVETLHTDTHQTFKDVGTIAASYQEMLNCRAGNTAAPGSQDVRTNREERVRLNTAVTKLAKQYVKFIVDNNLTPAQGTTALQTLIGATSVQNNDLVTPEFNTLLRETITDKLIEAKFHQLQVPTPFSSTSATAAIQGTLRDTQAITGVQRDANDQTVLAVLATTPFYKKIMSNIADTQQRLNELINLDSVAETVQSQLQKNNKRAEELHSSIVRDLALIKDCIINLNNNTAIALATQRLREIPADEAHAQERSEQRNRLKELESTFSSIRSQLLNASERVFNNFAELKQCQELLASTNPTLEFALRREPQVEECQRHLCEMDLFLNTIPGALNSVTDDQKTATALFLRNAHDRFDSGVQPSVVDRNAAHIQGFESIAAVVRALGLDKTTADAVFPKDTVINSLTQIDPTTLPALAAPAATVTYPDCISRHLTTLAPGLPEAKRVGTAVRLFIKDVDAHKKMDNLVNPSPVKRTDDDADTQQAARDAAHDFGVAVHTRLNLQVDAFDFVQNHVDTWFNNRTSRDIVFDELRRMHVTFQAGVDRDNAGALLQAARNAGLDS